MFALWWFLLYKKNLSRVTGGLHDASPLEIVLRVAGKGATVAGKGAAVTAEFAFGAAVRESQGA